MDWSEPLSFNENGKRGPQEAQGQDVSLCLLRSDMPRGAQEEKPWDSSQLFRILQKMLWKMEGQSCNEICEYYLTQMS